MKFPPQLNIAQDNQIDIDLVNELILKDKKNDLKGYLEVLNFALEKVKTVDNMEPLQEISVLKDKGIFIDLVDLKMPEEDYKEREFLRLGVIERIVYAKSLLPEGYSLCVRDAFRSERLVWKMFGKYVNRFVEGGNTKEEAELKVRNLLAMPDDPVPPGHMTGGAVDIILCSKDGDKISLEVDPDIISRDKQSYTNCPGLSDEIIRNREILLRAMELAGFNNYFREYWHFSYGDAYWAVRRKDKTAVYGIPGK